jgi:hypothetical protein
MNIAKDALQPYEIIEPSIEEVDENDFNEEEHENTDLCKSLCHM